MTVEFQTQGRELVARLFGELDHHHARETITQIEQQIDAALPGELRLDLSGLTFTDSSGIAVLIRASRCMAQIDGVFVVTNVPPQAKKVFAAAGLERMIRFEHTAARPAQA